MRFPSRNKQTFHIKNIERPNTKPDYLNRKGAVECGICSFKTNSDELIQQRGILVCGKCADETKPEGR